MDLSAQHQAALSSGAGIHLNQIMQWTGTTIHIPDHFLPNHMTLTPAGSFHAMGKRKNAIYINGTMPNVFVARQHLLVGIFIWYAYNNNVSIINLFGF